MNYERKDSGAGNREMVFRSFPLHDSRICVKQNAVHCLQVSLEKSYRPTLDLLSEMLQIIGDISLEAADIPHHSTLVKAFDRFTVAIW